MITKRQYSLLWALIFVVMALFILGVFLVNSYAADAVILNLKWEARGDYSSYKVRIEDVEGHVYNHTTTAEEMKLDLESGEEYDVELSGKDTHTGDYVLLQSMKWRSRARNEGVFSEVK